MGALRRSSVAISLASMAGCRKSLFRTVMARRRVEVTAAAAVKATSGASCGRSGLRWSGTDTEWKPWSSARRTLSCHADASEAPGICTENRMVPPVMHMLLSPPRKGG